MDAKSRKKVLRFLYCMLAIFVFFLGCVLFLLICSYTVDLNPRICPSYEKEDLAGVAGKETFTEEDYAFLLRQTGLGRAAVDALAESEGKNLAERLAEFQDALFFRTEIAHRRIADFTYQDFCLDPETKEIFYAPLAPLEPGDVLVSSCTHTVGYRHGHAALVLGDGVRLLEAPSSDLPSKLSKNANWFRSSANFMALRLKREEGESDEAYAARRRQIADDAMECLVGIPYSLTVGIFSKKDQGRAPSSTHCSHLIWQAFKNAGYDIDCDGGSVCTPWDIANSPRFETVQIYGFDVEKGW